MCSSDYYSLFEHTADIGIEVKGKTLEEAIERVLLAFYDLNVSLDNVEERMDRVIKGEGETLQDSLVYLLEEALFLFDTEGFVGKHVDVKVEGNTINATVRGELFNPQKHEPKFEIKAITYHQMVIKETDEGFLIRVVFDV